MARRWHGGGAAVARRWRGGGVEVVRRWCGGGAAVARRRRGGGAASCKTARCVRTLDALARFSARSGLSSSVNLASLLESLSRRIGVTLCWYGYICSTSQPAHPNVTPYPGYPVPRLPHTPLQNGTRVFPVSRSTGETEPSRSEPFRFAPHSASTHQSSVGFEI